MNLVDCFAPCFDAVAEALHGGDATADELRVRLARLVEQGVIKASAGFTPGAMMRARRLVSVWIDNRLGCDDWAGRSVWQDNPLLPGMSEGGETYLLDLAGHLETDNDEDGQTALLMLECLGRGINIDESCYNGLLGLLAERFKKS